MSASNLPADYAERAYAGVLGKIIGVYLGRPFEGWPYDRIMEHLGEITYYVHDRLNAPLIVTDDDISGTFTFLRALPDYHYTPDLTSEQIGRTWLNYLIEERTTLWWGGLGHSTEHTAYLRLKAGIPAPRSGSIEVNSQVVAEQIGAQIFIDGWAMVSPGNPGQAVRLAGQAGHVSHDGEAVYAAQVIAAIEAQAFVESDIHKLIDTALTFIPADSLVARMIHDIRNWHQEEPDWRRTRERIAERYGYDRYGGGCHVIPNHALIVLALLYGEDNFQRSLMIVNTSGWDTDCNSGNVGCILGIKNGLPGIDLGPDWRGPVADRLYQPGADGGRAITDAVIETGYVVQAGHALASVPYHAPKNGARFHFSYPGSVQGFQLEGGPIEGVVVKNAEHPTQAGERCLAITLHNARYMQPLRITTGTFLAPHEIKENEHYGLSASPTLYSGQRVRASIIAARENTKPLDAHLFIYIYNEQNQLTALAGPALQLTPGEQHRLEWTIPDTKGQPIAAIGLEIESRQSGTLFLDYLTWSGVPHSGLTQPSAGGKVWQRAWVNAADRVEFPSDGIRVIQNYGRGMLIQGTREWDDYQVSARIAPHMAEAVGLGARVQGLKRFYALLLTRDGYARLVKSLDGEIVLAETAFSWEWDRPYTLSFQVQGSSIRAFVDGQQLFSVQDTHDPLLTGAIALLSQEGRMRCDLVSVEAVNVA